MSDAQANEAEKNVSLPGQDLHFGPHSLVS